MKKLITIIFIAKLVASCAEPIQSADQPIEEKPMGIDDVVKAPLNKAKETFETLYDISVLTNKGLIGKPADGEQNKALCSGTMTAKLLSNSQMIFPDADFKCTKFGISVPIAKLLNPPDISKLPTDAMVPTGGKYIGIKYAISDPNPRAKESDPHSSATRMKLDPPAPFILGPVIQNSAAFAGYGVRVGPITITTNTNLQTQGYMTLQVAETGLSYTTPAGFPFNDVIHWVRKSEGFEELPAHMKTLPPMAGIQELHFWSSTQPIAFTRIVLVIKIKNLVEGFGGFAAKLFVGDTIVVDLKLREHREL